MNPDTFLWSGVASGVKKSGKPDLAVAYSAYPSTVAGVFTQNSFPAAPVQVDRERLGRSSEFRGLVVNSGVANAATGKQGRENCRAVIEATAERLGLEFDEILAASTGHIGDPLPVETITESLPGSVDALEEDPDSFSRAILTTDTQKKTVSKEIPGLDACMKGIAKGAGMIRPDMATMLAFVFFDHPVDADWWQDALERACARSFNRITVDGEMSTNDTVLAFGARRPEREPIDASHEAAKPVRECLESVCESLARAIVLDGEGSTRLIEVRVTGAAREEDAEAVAESVANSNLVKTALYGGDPNWGRVFSATGATGLDLEADEVTISMGGHMLYDPSEGTRTIPRVLEEELESPGEITIRIDLGRGSEEARRLTCDLTEKYVEINADYEP